MITNFISRALSGQPLIINGDGRQYRNFIYVEDLARGNIAALQENAKNQIFNLEGIRPISIKEVADTISKIISSVTIEYRDVRTGDFSGRIASNDKSLKMLGWKPIVDLEEGVIRYIDWHKSEASSS